MNFPRFLPVLLLVIALPAAPVHQLPVVDSSAPDQVLQVPVVNNLYPDTPQLYRGNTLGILCEVSNPADPETPATAEIHYRKPGWSDFQDCGAYDNGGGTWRCDLYADLLSEDLGLWDFRCRASNGIETSDWRYNNASVEVLNNLPSWDSVIPGVSLPENSANTTDLDLTPLVSDVENTPDALVFSVASQSDPTLVNCAVTENHFLNCTAPFPDSFGFTDVTVNVTDLDNGTSSTTFRITVTPTRFLFISNVSVVKVQTAAQITWDSTRPSDSLVVYDASPSTHDFQALDAYANWSSTQGENGLSYEYAHDGTTWQPMLYDALQDQWAAASSPQASFTRLPQPGLIQWAPGTSGGLPLPPISLRWTASSPGYAFLDGSFSCLGDPFCTGGDGVNLLVQVNSKTLDVIPLYGSETRSLRESLGFLNANDSLRLVIDAKQFSEYDLGTFAGLKIKMASPYLFQQANDTNTTRHSVIIRPLDPNTSYRYRLQSCSHSECTVSDEFTFKTLPIYGGQGGSPPRKLHIQDDARTS